MFAWAADGIFPRAVAGVHPRFRTPHVAIVASGVMATLGILGSHLAGDFFLGVDILVTSMLVNFLLMAISVLTLPRAQPGARARGDGAPFASAPAGVGDRQHLRAGRFPGVHTCEGPDGSCRRLVFPLHLAVGSRAWLPARVVYWREVRALRRAGVDLHARFATLPPE